MHHDDWREQLSEQAGVVRAEAAVCAMGRSAVRARLDAGRWQRLHGRVLAAFSGSPNPEQRRWAAVLHGGPGAVLSHATAAELGGLRGFESPTLHVSVPHGRTVPPVAGIRIHLTRRIEPADVHPAARPPRMRIERSLLDMAAVATSDDHVRAVLSAGVQQRLTTPARLRSRLDGERWARRRRLIEMVLADVEGGSQSLPELRFLAVIREAGLPSPDRQVVRFRPGGGRAYLDARWDEARLTVEIDGMGHLDPRAWAADLARQNDLVVGGDRVLRFPSFVVRDHPEAVATALTDALHSGRS
jgi:hypothetical protein